MKNQDELIRKLLETAEGRARLAKSMVSPKRCGGRDYSKDTWKRDFTTLIERHSRREYINDKRPT